jgi:DNA-binding response OmpR family regulator
MSQAEHILIVEDDLNLGFLLVDFLEGEGFRVKLCRDGQSGLGQFRKNAFDLCILDVMLPKVNGFDLARQMRQLDSIVPFLFLTAKSLKEDILQGYALGAEDYLTKPFDEDELLCKIRVIMRRSAAAEDNLPNQFTLGDYRFDYERQELALYDQHWRLTEKENEVLRELCLHRNRILRRDEAVQRIYGKKDYFLGRSFDVFISRLRKRLGEDPRVCIENVYRVGFMLKVEE